MQIANRLDALAKYENAIDEARQLYAHERLAAVRQVLVARAVAERSGIFRSAALKRTDELMLANLVQESEAALLVRQEIGESFFSDLATWDRASVGLSESTTLWKRRVSGEDRRDDGV
jgi:hypothetical protein